MSRSRFASFGRFSAFAILFATCFSSQAFAKAAAAAPARAAQIQNADAIRAQGIDLGRVAPSLPMDHLQLVLQRSPRQQQALNILLDRQKRPGDPLFQQWLTPSEFDETFGLTDTAIATIKQWLAAQGFEVTRVAVGELAIDFTGTAAQVEQAFHVEIHNYRLPDGTTHYANAGRPVVPSELRERVLGVTGLSNKNVLAGDCSAVPDAVKQALERNRQQHEQAQGYVGAGPDTPLCGQAQISGPVHARPDATTFTESLLVSFTGIGDAAPGADPFYGNLIQASDGNFYGTTEDGGANNDGTVFQITSSGTFTLLHSFSSATTDGGVPDAGLVQGTDGNFYGTTFQGGANGEGTVFQITSGGTFTLLHSFSSATTDGEYPYAGLVQGTDGNFYGTTFEGGANGDGTVFQITSGGTFTLLHSFSSATNDGNGPFAGLVQGTDGNFYGTTEEGGANNDGTVFQITSSGTFTLLHSFSSATTDGEYPVAGLVQGTDGNFYGTSSEGGANGEGTVFQITSGDTFTLLHSFSTATTNGRYPVGGLVQGTDGNFYGTTRLGGANGDGVIFQITSGGTFTLLHSFSTAITDGKYPYDGLVQGTDGNFYGVTYLGGADNDGVIFKLTASPALAAPVVLSASPSTVTVGQPFTMTYSTANADVGTVNGTLNQCFATNTAGDTTGWTGIFTGTPTTQTKMLTATALGAQTYSFTCGGMESGLVTVTGVAAPTTATISAVSAPYGSTAGITVTATESGSAGVVTGGVVTFSVNTPATGSFLPTTCTLAAGGTCTTTFTPTGTLAVGTYSSIQASFAAVGSYGAATGTNMETITALAGAGSITAVSAPYGSAANVAITATAPAGTVVTFGVTAPATGSFNTATCTVAVAATTCSSNYVPTGTLAVGAYANDLTASFSNPNYTFAAGATSTLTITTAYAESLLVSFTGIGGAAPGANPFYGNLIQASDGNFYGTTEAGGANNDGTVFQITPTGTYTVLHSFSTATTDGGAPFGGLVQGTDGNYYGTTYNGGANGVGTVFQITSSGTFTLLHSFSSATTDGEIPPFGLVQGTDGNFYGTSFEGGANGEGTVFQITSGGTFTLLHSFSSATNDGNGPFAGLVQGTDGNFYGTTEEGGANNDGTVFQITSGGTFTLLHSFSSATTDGRYPVGGLVQGTDGNFYGTTRLGGANGEGTVFQITSGGTFTLLHSFSSATTDGGVPLGGLVQGTDGNFYGTTRFGGANGDGVIFQITSGGTFTLLHSFSTAITDGEYPYDGLVQGTDGNFYGVTYQGGADNDGVIFKLTASPALAAPVVLSASPSTVTVGQPFTMTYSTANADVGTVNGTLNQCFATNTAGDTTGWTGIFTGTPTTQTKMLTATALGAQTYSLTCGGMESGLVTVTGLAAAPTDSLSAVSAPYGSTTGVSITATSNAVGSVVTFGDTSGGGTFNPTTCTISGTTCISTYMPSGTLAVGAYASDLTASFGASGIYSTGNASSTLTITQITSDTLTLTAATPGTATAGTTSSALTATFSSPAAGITVTFTDATSGTMLGTGTTNSSGVATLTITPATAGVSAGLNSITAATTANADYGVATSSPVTVYISGIVLSSDRTHDFSIYPGTYDGSPVCNGSNGTNGSTCTAGYGITVTNITAATQAITINSANLNANSPNKAFSVATNCPANGIAAAKTCEVVFYYLPPYGDGCSLTTTCTTTAGQPGPEGTYESGTWSISSGSQLVGISAGGTAAFPTTVEGKALLAAGSALSVTPTSLTFAAQAPGAVSGTQDVTITNVGPSSLGVTYALTGTGAAKFTEMNGCAATLAAGAICQIKVSYSDASVATDMASLVIAPASGSAITVTLSGTTANNSGLSLSTDTYNFGSLTDGTTSTYGLKITNNSATTAATLAFIHSGSSEVTYVTGGCPASLAAGASCQIQATFAPTTTGAVTNTLTISSNLAILPGGTGSAGNYSDGVTFSGTGVTGGGFTATSAGHNFGTTSVGSAATSYGTELKNNTASAITLTLGGGTFASNGAADGYTVQTNCGATLAANANCELIFYFTPAAVGTTQVFYPVSAVTGTTNVPLISGGTTYTGITLSGTGQ